VWRFKDGLGTYRWRNHACRACHRRFRRLGLALARALAERGWALIIDAREDALRRVHTELAARTDLVASLATWPTRLTVVTWPPLPTGLTCVNNASALGPSPLPKLADYPLDEWVRVYRVDVLAPLGLIQATLTALGGGIVVNISSDAAVEAYEGWGGYGSAKAALDQLTAVLGAEHPDLAVYSFDPGDMRTAMHQQAFPGQNISDRPETETVVPAMLELITTRPASGRYRAADITQKAGIVQQAEAWPRPRTSASNSLRSCPHQHRRKAVGSPATRSGCSSREGGGSSTSRSPTSAAS
jgi:NAD(P)-dependent dehydrogenase (short-subunit alcohol dehydrogenase family)